MTFILFGFSRTRPTHTKYQSRIHRRTTLKNQSSHYLQENVNFNVVNIKLSEKQCLKADDVSFTLIPNGAIPYLYWGQSYLYLKDCDCPAIFLCKERKVIYVFSFPWNWLFITCIKPNLTRLKKTFHVNSGLRQFRHMPSSLRLSSLQVRFIS